MQGLKKALGSIWSTWKKVGQFIGDWIARVALTVFYFVVALPFGLGTRLLGDPLRAHPIVASTYWQTREEDQIPHDLQEARRQF
jgi:hypothetical protein